jgi:hypothetical protein
LTATIKFTKALVFMSDSSLIVSLIDLLIVVALLLDKPPQRTNAMSDGGLRKAEVNADC